MKDLEKSITEELDCDTEYAFNASDEELFKRATVSANKQQGTKDLLALGMASIWVVFASIFIKILKPIFKNMANNTKAANTTKTTNTNTASTGTK